MRLRDRRWALQVADLDVSGLDMSFRVEKSTKRTPNTAEIRIWNLSDTSRSIVETGDPRVVILRAGYAEDGNPPPVIFLGDVRKARTEIDAVDVVTIVPGRDGGQAFSDARISKAYPAGAPVARAIRDAVDALGIGPGNLSEFEARLRLRSGGDTFPDGYVAEGPARATLDALIRGTGLRWSIQDGALQVQERGRALATQAVLLTPETGLVGSPSKGEKGIVTARCLIQKGLDPGRRVVVESRLVSGEYEIRRVVYEGETAGQAWYATLELRPIA